MRSKSCRDLRARARRLIEAGDESKFEKLREVLEDPRYAEDKWLIFSEHRDTVSFLVRRIEGLGYSDQVAVIHGGMDWPEREEQVERFRQAEGARFLVATDAAGEGINLQFCRLMVNYDIPWNPARLEQRMGRIHRYRQKHDVHIVNLVASDTWEGSVLETLLDKLESVRRALSSDKVFDVIGRLLQNVSLRDYMAAALTGEGERNLLDLEQALSESAAQRPRQESGQRCTARQERSRLASQECDESWTANVTCTCSPRTCASSSNLPRTKLGIGIQGDLDESVLSRASHSGSPRCAPARAGEVPTGSANEAACSPPLRSGERCIWLHPGEPVFDALCSTVIDTFSHHARRGAIFIDPHGTRGRAVVSRGGVHRRINAGRPAVRRTSCTGERNVSTHLGAAPPRVATGGRRDAGRDVGGRIAGAAHRPEHRPRLRASSYPRNRPAPRGVSLRRAAFVEDSPRTSDTTAGRVARAAPQGECELRSPIRSARQAPFCVGPCRDGIQ